MPKRADTSWVYLGVNGDKPPLHVHLWLIHILYNAKYHFLTHLPRFLPNHCTDYHQIWYLFANWERFLNKSIGFVITRPDTSQARLIWSFTVGLLFIYTTTIPVLQCFRWFPWQLISLESRGYPSTMREPIF